MRASTSGSRIGMICLNLALKTDSANKRKRERKEGETHGERLRGRQTGKEEGKEGRNKQYDNFDECEQAPQPQEYEWSAYIWPWHVNTKKERKKETTRQTDRQIDRQKTDRQTGKEEEEKEGKDDAIRLMWQRKKKKKTSLNTSLPSLLLHAILFHSLVPSFADMQQQQSQSDFARNCRCVVWVLVVVGLVPACFFTLPSLHSLGLEHSQQQQQTNANDWLGQELSMSCLNLGCGWFGCSFRENQINIIFQCRDGLENIRFTEQFIIHQRGVQKK